LGNNVLRKLLAVLVTTSYAKIGQKVFDLWECFYIVGVAMSRKHHSKEFDDLIDLAISKGIRVIRKGNKFSLFPCDPNKPFHLFHRGDLGVKPLRQWLKNN
jgi:hypothetical protein